MRSTFRIVRKIRYFIPDIVKFPDGKRGLIIYGFNNSESGMYIIVYESFIKLSVDNVTFIRWIAKSPSIKLVTDLGEKQISNLDAELRNNYAIIDITELYEVLCQVSEVAVRIDDIVYKFRIPAKLFYRIYKGE
ncbi:MAG: hypothetical protein KA807_17570 [Prolixibacteraceae bacterium]|nr:hypothetical protein [Prolixibacteraceae bacterium]